MDSLQQKLEILSKHIKKPLDFILHCGDVCHHGDVSDYLEVKQYFEEFFPQIPILFTVGNHDNYEAMDSVFSTETKKISGFVSQCGDLQVISLSNSQGENGSLSSEQALWFAEQVDRGKASILLTHHHFFSEQSPMPYAEICPQFYEAMKSPKLKGIFTGHTHYFYEGDCQGVPYFATDSLSFQGEDSGEGYLYLRESSGYNLFSYKEGQISLEQHGMLSEQKKLPLYFFD